MDRPGKGIAVDGSCIGNPGQAEYRGVDIQSGNELFRVRIGEATNNIAEFLAIVHGLAMVKKMGAGLNIYSDSATAIAWVKSGRCNTTFVYGRDLVDRAEKWLSMNSRGIVKKWETNKWGEIPADFGRK
jgi:ribonuclease HI